MFMAASAFAAAPATGDGPVANVLQAVIIGPSDTPARRTIILDASASHIVGNNVQYFWYINDNPNPISKTVDAIFTPERTGELRFRLVVSSVVDGRSQEDAEEHVVTVYARKVVLIADGSVTSAGMKRLRDAAASGSTYLRVIHTGVPATSRGGEEALVAAVGEESNAFLDAESVILWGDGVPIPGLQALRRALESEKGPRTLQQQTLLIATDLNLRTIARTATGPVRPLDARKTLVVRPSRLAMLLTAKSDTEFLFAIRQVEETEPSFLDVATVQIAPWNLPTLLIQAMVTAGLTSQTALLLLALPVIATILAFLKQVVGMTTFGLFTPAIIALSFLVLGWVVGLVFLVFILTAGYASRAMLRRLHILYVPKLAIILGIGSFSILLLLALGTLYGVALSHDTVFVLLIMSTLVESFLNVKSEQGLSSAVMGIGQTVVAALLCVFVILWPPFRAFLLAYPEIVLLTFVLNIVIGRWTGLRITEYFRFREVFRHLNAQE